MAKAENSNSPYEYVRREIIEKLSKRNDLELILDEHQLRIVPKDPAGFAIEVVDDETEVTVFLGDFSHAHFEREQEALNYVGAALSSDFRVIVMKKGSLVFRTRTEQLINGEWKNSGSSGLLFWPFWRTTTVEIRQNQIYKSES